MPFYRGILFQKTLLGATFNHSNTSASNPGIYLFLHVGGGEAYWTRRNTKKGNLALFCANSHLKEEKKWDEVGDRLLA